MEPISIMLLAAVLTKMVTTHREDLEYARRGQESPRHKMKMARFRAAQQAGQAGVRAPARPGASGYLAELWYDAWEDLTEHRRRKRQERKDGEQAQRAEEKRQREESLREWSRRTLNTRPDGRPLDDTVDVAGGRPGPVHPDDPNNTRNCPVCKGEVVLDGRPCPRCLAEQQRRNAEWEKRSDPDNPTPEELREDEEILFSDRQKCPRCNIGRLAEMSDGSTRCPYCEPFDVAREAPEFYQHQRDADLTADGVLSELLRGPAGSGHPRCDHCFKAFTVTADGRTVCGCTNQPDDTTSPAWPTVTREVRERIRSELYGKCAYREFIEGIGDQWCDMPVIGDDPYCDTHTTKPNTDSRPLAPVIPLFPSINSVEKEISMSEVHGLSTAIAYANDIANVHTSFATAGAEGYVGALERGGNSGEVIASAREAMEASGIAADKWTAHKAILEQQMTVKEAYQSQPDAADKGFLLNG